MKRIAVLLFVAFAFSASAATGRKANAVARSVYYPDGSHTECVQDLILREQTETTYTPQGVKAAKKVYLLNEQGLPTQGNIYDGKDQLKARAQFLFDSFERLSEQRMFNLQGEVFQRIVFSYDSKGKQLTPKSYSYNVKAPDMKPAAIDFTKGNQGQAPRMDRSQGDSFSPGQGNVPVLPDGAMGIGTPTQPQAPMSGGVQDSKGKETGKSKGGFFKNLFKKKDSETKK